MGIGSSSRRGASSLERGGHEEERGRERDMS